MIKIYLYKNIEHTKIKKFPSFEIEGPTSAAEQEMFKNLFRDICAGNTDYIFIGPAIFQKKLFNYAIMI